VAAAAKFDEGSRSASKENVFYEDSESLENEDITLKECEVIAINCVAREAKRYSAISL
jgi:hypothetical protein